MGVSGRVGDPPADAGAHPGRQAVHVGPDGRPFGDAAVHPGQRVGVGGEAHPHPGRGTGRCRGALIRSLITIKALTYAPTGGLVAAPTTSLPARAPGVGTWDYRYCWLRDSALAQD